MKQIINGKKYDTETAKEIKHFANTYNSRDLNFFEETLYRKKTGEFFLYGTGGPASRYAENVDSNLWRGSSKIIPVTESEAREWAENHMDADSYEDIFGGVPE